MAEVTVNKEIRISGATLELNEKEVWFLVDVLSVIGGSPLTSRRGIQKRILDELEAQGVNWKDSPHRASNLYQIDDLEGGRGQLYFK